MWALHAHCMVAALRQLNAAHPRAQGEYPEIGRALQPLFEQYGVAAYFCGHEHNLQYLHAERDATHYLVSGALSPLLSVLAAVLATLDSVPPHHVH